MATVFTAVTAVTVVTGWLRVGGSIVDSAPAALAKAGRMLGATDVPLDEGSAMWHLVL